MLIGLAYGPANPAGSMLLAELTPPGRRSAVFSFKQTSVPAGGAAAGLMVPAIAQWIGWQAAVAAVAGLCLVAIVLVQPERAKLDGARGTHPAFSGRSALAPLAIIARDRSIRAYGLVGLCYAALQLTFSAVFVTFLVDRASLTTVAAGAALSVALVISVVMRVFWGWAADRFGSHPVLIALGLLMATAAFVSLLVTPSWTYLAILALGVWFGAAGYSWNGVYLAAVADLAGPLQVAAATSGTVVLVFLGALVGPALFTALVTLTEGYDAGFIALGILAALPAFILLAGRLRR